MIERKILFGLIGFSLVVVFILTSCQSAVTPVAPAGKLPASAAPVNPTVPPVTDTVAPAPTDTAAPTATETPAATATTAPAATNTVPPTIQTVAQVIPAINAYCRKGPGTGYFALTFLQKGTAYNVVGRNDLNTWWLVQASATIKCWMGDPNASQQGPVTQAPAVLVPPLPVTPSTFDRSFICSTTNLNVSLQWTPVDNSVGYSIYRNGSLLVSVAAGVTSYDDIDAPRQVDLSYELQAFNDYGSSASISTNVAACD